MLRKNNFTTKQKRFWPAKMASILLSAGLCLSLAGQSQIVHGEASEPQTEEQKNQQTPSNNGNYCTTNNLLGKGKTSDQSSPDISSTKKDFTSQIPDSNQGVGVPAPNNNYHFTNSPSAPGFTEGKITNPGNPVLTGEAPNINLNEQNADLGNVAAVKGNHSKKIKSDAAHEQSEATENSKAKDNNSEQSIKNKHKKVYYANIFQAKDTDSKSRKSNKQETKEAVSGLTADVINRKGQKVGYVDKHDRVHLEKLSYSGKMDSPSLTIGLVTLLAAGLLTTIGFANSKKRI